jgi:hypothetical protein
MTDKLSNLIDIWQSCNNLSRNKDQEEFLEGWLSENIQHFLYINPDESRADLKTLNKLKNEFSNLNDPTAQAKGYNLE